MLNVSEVSVLLGKQTILQELNFGPLLPGTMTALLGINAAGKSTLLRCIAGELNSSGTVDIEGQAVENYPAHHRNRPAYVPQEISMKSSLRVFEAVLLASKQGSSWRIDQNELNDVMYILKLLDINDLANRKLFELSGGQRQLVSIAQALIRNPRVLLLDEPTSALDLQNQFDVLTLLCKLTKERSMCVIMAIHDINHALRFADHVIVLDKGRVGASGHPLEVITPSLLEDIYRVKARIEYCSQGNPFLVVDESIK